MNVGIQSFYEGDYDIERGQVILRTYLFAT